MSKWQHRLGFTSSGFALAIACAEADRGTVDTPDITAPAEPIVATAGMSGAPSERSVGGTSGGGAPEPPGTRREGRC